VGLIGGSLKRPRIGLEQEVAALDEGTLPVVLAHEVSVDPSSDLRVDVADERPYIFKDNWHVSYDDRLDPDRWGRKGHGGPGRIATACGGRRHHRKQEPQESVGVTRDSHSRLAMSGWCSAPSAGFAGATPLGGRFGRKAKAPSELPQPLDAHDGVP